MSGFASIEDAVDAIRHGGLVVVVDDEDRENEGDLIGAADAVTAQSIAFLVNHTSGVICVSIDDERADRLELPLMVGKNTEPMGTAFTVTVDAVAGTTTGISAADRATTIRALADPGTVVSDLTRPGHVFPLRARPGGVLKRAGHTEAAIDLARLAGRQPAGVLCELVREDGTVARSPDLLAFGAEHHLPVVTIADLIRYRSRSEQLVERTSSARVPTRHGEFTAVGYRSVLDGEEHVAFTIGDLAAESSPLVRVHSECLTGDVIGSLRCDCGEQLELALEKIGEAGTGVLVYLRGHEGRGIGIGRKLHAYALQDQGLDTVDANLALGLPADSREYGIGAQILTDLGVASLRLLSNNPAKRCGLTGYGLVIEERVPLTTEPNSENRDYLLTKQERMGHVLGSSLEESTP